MSRSNDYNFISIWRVKGTVDSVFNVISDFEKLPQWWPSVYLQTDQLKKGDVTGIGRVLDLKTRGWLPYTLEWRLTVTNVARPERIKIEADGDFVGTGVWRFEQEGPIVRIRFDWNIRADKPLIRYFSFLAKPLFAANHRWAMARGEESLKLELARRNAQSVSELIKVPLPPPPNRTSALWLTVFALTITSGAFFLVRSRSRRNHRGHGERAKK